jgi:hypothetical protein
VQKHFFFINLGLESEQFKKHLFTLFPQVGTKSQKVEMRKWFVFKVESCQWNVSIDLETFITFLNIRPKCQIEHNSSYFVLFVLKVHQACKLQLKDWNFLNRPTNLLKKQFLLFQCDIFKIGIYLKKTCSWDTYLAIFNIKTKHGSLGTNSHSTTYNVSVYSWKWILVNQYLSLLW